MYFYQYNLFIDYAKETPYYFDIKSKIDTLIMKYKHQDKVHDVIIFNGKIWVNETIVSHFIGSEMFDIVCRIIQTLEHNPVIKCLYVGGGEK